METTDGRTIIEENGAWYYGGAIAAELNVYGHKSGFASLTLDGKNLSPYTMFGEAHELTADPAGKNNGDLR